MAKIVGGTAASSMLVPDWNQTNPNRADYIKNKPDVANALKGSANGNPIVIDDSSPLEHEIKANTRIPFENEYVFNPTMSRMPSEKAVLVVSSVGRTLYPDDDEDYPGELELNVYFEGVWKLEEGFFLKPYPPIPKVGDKMVYNPDDGSLTLIYDVTKYGKNLLSFENFVYNANTVDITFNDGLYRLVQKQNANSDFIIGDDLLKQNYNGVPVFPAGTYFFTAEQITIAETQGGKETLAIKYSFVDGSGSGEIVANRPVTVSKPFKITAIGHPKKSRLAGLVYESFFQLECGSVGTDWELFKKGETYTADENGNVSGIMANGEAMTLIADTDATISAEYNRDLNKVIADLQNAIATMGAAAVAIPEEV